MKEEKKSCVTEVYSRITGYFQQFNSFNPGKKAEFLSRKHFDKSAKAVTDDKKA